MRRIIRHCSLILILLASTMAQGEDGGVAFPLRPSENGRFLVDSNGKPFLYNADTAWKMFYRLTPEEAADYFANRKAKKFNAIQIILSAFYGEKTYNGLQPFGENDDFSKPNAAFFDHVESYLKEAERQNLFLAIAPLWVGCCGEGYGGKHKDGRPKPIKANGPEKGRAFGKYLGARYGQFKNIMWIMGGDNDPGEDAEEIRQIALGIKEAAPHHLITYHPASSHSSTDVYPNEEWLDAPMVYTYFRGFNKAWNKNQPDVYEISFSEHNRKPVKPFFLGESTYEGEHGDWGSALQARKQAYWCVLSGGMGHAYGSPNWKLEKNWREVMELPGAASLAHFYSLFESRPWQTLVPDEKREVAVAGQGAFAQNDYATAACAEDGSFLMAYLPSPREIVISLDMLSGDQAVAWWFNPRDGKAAEIGRFESKGIRDFTPPADGDWVLVIDDAKKDYPAPGGVPSRKIVDPSAATLRVDAGKQIALPIPRFITGKFCEHLGTNIYNGMDAQILRNPTLADFPFSTGGNTPDGVVKFHSDSEAIERETRRQARRFGWPDAAMVRLVESYNDGLAAFWTRTGDRDSVAVSPDTGPGGRAQRVEAKSAGEGIAQWTWLPLHRARRYEFELLARSPDLASLAVSITAPDEQSPCSSFTIVGLSREWGKFRGELAIDPSLPADVAYRFAVTANAPGQFVIDRVLLRPADHVKGFDPDVIRFLKDSRLPLLRWPGGNFVSGYHWEDGVGPNEARPTRPNLAWGGVETNLFGTDEFVAFCRAVGCEPMICINAGDGTPDEAARWIEYCNGPATSPMGKRRAANGHPEPYNIRHWEVGNELWGRWQVNWTTARGYVDRYKEFSNSMLAADPTIQLYACGAPVFWGKDWNDTMIDGLGATFDTTTDHPLIGGQVSPATDPLDVHRDFMAVPDVLERKWAELQKRMAAAGIREPHLAVTELQLFARIGGARKPDEPARLTSRTLVSPPTLAEALYDVLIYHASVRLSPFVTMVTHSATVNHGGGLRKERERVFANPCHYAQGMFAEFAGAVPVAIDLESPEESAPRVLPQLRDVTKEQTYRVVDALAARAEDGGLLLSIVHRGTEPVRLNIELANFAAAPAAQVRTLSADVPWAANSLESPEAVKPVESTVEIRDGRLALDLRPFTVMRIRIPEK